MTPWSRLTICATAAVGSAAPCQVPSFELPKAPAMLTIENYPDCTTDFLKEATINGRITALQRCRLDIEQYRQTVLVRYERILHIYNRRLLAADVAVRATRMPYAQKLAASLRIREEIERVTPPDGEYWAPYFEAITKSRGDVPFIGRKIARIIAQARGR